MNNFTIKYKPTPKFTMNTKRGIPAYKIPGLNLQYGVYKEQYSQNVWLHLVDMAFCGCILAEKPFGLECIHGDEVIIADIDGALTIVANRRCSSEKDSDLALEKCGANVIDIESLDEGWAFAEIVLEWKRRDYPEHMFRTTHPAHIKRELAKQNPVHDDEWQPKRLGDLLGCHDSGLTTYMTYGIMADLTEKSEWVDVTREMLTT